LFDNVTARKKQLSQWTSTSLILEKRQNSGKKTKETTRNLKDVSKQKKHIDMGPKKERKQKGGRKCDSSQSVPSLQKRQKDCWCGKVPFYSPDTGQREEREQIAY